MTTALNIIIRGGLLPETKAYCFRSGATDQRNIDAFIRGLKWAGMWDSLVECWILPAALNAGTGNTVYGLKGVSNGTRIQTPSWGVDGMTFATDATTNRDRYISCPWTGLYDYRTNSTVVAVSDMGEANPSPVSTTDQFLIGSNATNSNYGAFNLRDSGPAAGDGTISAPINMGQVNYALVSAQTIAAGVNRMWSAQKENNLVGNSNVQGNKLFRDATQIANGSNAAQVGFEVISNATTSLLIGAAKTTQPLSVIGKMSFAAVFSDWTLSPAVIRQILKDTILQGILP